MAGLPGEGDSSPSGGKKMMEEFSNPATVEDLKAVISSLNARNAEYLLIGGYALFCHGYNRGTTDIDIVVPANAENGKMVKEALMELPDQAVRDVELEWFEEGETIRVADAFVVDVMFNPCGVPYETLKEYAETIEFDGIQIRTVNLEGLILTKQSMRDKDVMDRAVLEQGLAEHKESLGRNQGFTL